MFKLDPEQTFRHKVVAKVPVDGGYRSDEFRATFRVVPVDKMAQFDLHDGPSSTEFLKHAVVHLDDVAGVDDAPIEYSDELRDQVIALPYARVALVRAYHEAVSGALLGN